jgi:hypothetical protein
MVTHWLWRLIPSCATYNTKQNCTRETRSSGLLRGEQWCHNSPSNTPKERSSQLLHGGSLKSQVILNTLAQFLLLNNQSRQLIATNQSHQLIVTNRSHQLIATNQSHHLIATNLDHSKSSSGKTDTDKNVKQDIQYTYKRNIEARSCNYCCGGKQVLHIVSVCVALVMQHAMRMRRIVICQLPRSTKFSTLSHNRHYFRMKKKVTGYKILVFTSSTMFVWNISHSKKNWAICDQKQILVFM